MNQLKLFGHLTSGPPECLLGEVFGASPTVRRPWGRPRVRSRDYVSELAWECLSVPSRRARGRGSEEGALGFFISFI